ncbi:glycoside hydrolase family 18 protein [Flavitalea sp.]|nr:glycosyl hydrolase family 18 protein [Flavitalea sp.]
MPAKKFAFTGPGQKFLVITLIGVLLAVISLAQPAKSPAIIAYYTGHYKSIENYDISKLTHIVYGFARLKGSKLILGHKADTATVKKLVSLKKQHPALKIIVAFGGWGGCKTCSQVFSSGPGRIEFAESALQLLKYFDADGLDLDWEYPSIPGYPGHSWSTDDKSNFTLLLKTIAEMFSGDKELSFAAGAYQESLEKSIDWREAARYVDRIHLMTYDLRSSRHNSTGHHAPLYSTTKQNESADYAVKYLIDSGVPKSKIVIGAAFYGRVFSMTVRDNSITTRGNNLLDQPGKFKHFVLFSKLKSIESDPGGFHFYYDSIAQAAYGFNPQRKEFVTFDNMISVKAKAKYVLTNGLAGIMFWELSQDKPRDGFLSVITSMLVVPPDNPKNE